MIEDFKEGVIMIGLQTLKMVAGAIAAILIAQFIGLEYALSAGIITMLSVLDTKRQTIKAAFTRVIATIIGLIVAGIMFYLLGISVYVYGLILLIFIPIAKKLGLNNAIIVNAVLISHILSYNDLAFYHLLNELSLLLIGVSMGLVLNVYVPSIEEEIKYQQMHIEDTMKTVLHNFSLNLTNQCGIDELVKISELEREIKKGKKLAYRYLNNHFFIDHTYYVEYMEMREKQLYILKSMNKQLNQVFETETIPVILSMVTEEVKDNLKESNDAMIMLRGLANIKTNYKTRPLPKTREEFEERARLYTYFNDLEEFLLVKSEFIMQYKEIKYCNV